MEKILDKKFGEMFYSYGWCKFEKEKLLNQDNEIKIVALAYKNEEITDIQRSSYSKFKSEIIEVAPIIHSAIIEYLSKEYTCLECEGSYSIKEILFERDSDVINIVCNNSLDRENGIGLSIVDKKVVKIGFENIVL